MAIERIVDPSLNNRGDDGAADEQIIEVTLRPTNFNEYIRSRSSRNVYFCFLFNIAQRDYLQQKI